MKLFPVGQQKCLLPNIHAARLPTPGRSTACKSTPEPASQGVARLLMHSGNIPRERDTALAGSMTSGDWDEDAEPSAEEQSMMDRFAADYARTWDEDDEGVLVDDVVEAEAAVEEVAGGKGRSSKGRGRRADRRSGRPQDSSIPLEALPKAGSVMFACSSCKIQAES